MSFYFKVERFPCVTVETEKKKSHLLRQIFNDDKRKGRRKLLKNEERSRKGKKKDSSWERRKTSRNSLSSFLHVSVSRNKRENSKWAPLGVAGRRAFKRFFFFSAIRLQTFFSFLKGRYYPSFIFLIAFPSFFLKAFSKKKFPWAMSVIDILMPPFAAAPRNSSSVFPFFFTVNFVFQDSHSSKWS